MSTELQRSGPLAGVKVLQVAGIGPSPFCAMLLSDMGADVVRIDRPESLAFSPFSVIDRGRRSVPLDLKSPVGRDALLRLADRADILIEGFRPGVMERMDLGPETLLARHPALVYGRMTGWGQDGPYAAMAGHDVNYVALTGALNLIGPADRPMMPLNLAADYGGGGAFLAIGVLAALNHARRTGEGQVVDAAMVDGCATLMAATYGGFAAGMIQDEREANVGNGAAHYMQIYRCACGGFISLAAYEHQFYREMLGLLGVAQDPSFDVQNDPASWPEQRARIAALIATRTRDEWSGVFEGTDACFAPVMTMTDAPLHPHNVARKTFVDIDGVIQPAPAPRFSSTPSRIQGAPPALGEGAGEALADWGWSQEEIAVLRLDA